MVISTITASAIPAPISSLTTSTILAHQTKNIDSIVALFPQTAVHITEQAECYMQEALRSIHDIIAIPDQERTFENTARALDRVSTLSNLALWGHFLGLIKETSTDQEMRDVSHKTLLAIDEFWIDNIGSNVQLFRALKSYVENQAIHEDLTAEERYFLECAMEQCIRAGLHLDEEKRAALTTIKKELSRLCLEFNRNISADQSKIACTSDDLAGIGEEFVHVLPKKEDSEYFEVGVDYPTYFKVMEECTVENTRKRLYGAFNNRAYPANDALLKQIIEKRTQLAQLLGFASFAAFDIANQMACNITTVQAFIDDLAARSRDKSAEEMALLQHDLPPSVTLTEDKKFKPWDLAFVKAQHKKEHLLIDETLISQYFPLQQTIDALLNIYHQFLGITFTEITSASREKLWHEDVRIIQARTHDNALLGHLFLDLHPRPNKYSHACHIALVGGIRESEKTEKIPAVSVVLANFPKSHGTKPALLRRDDVRTFFHEFGHAIHALCGATGMGSFSGTRVKRDFVEMPSQMLEEWLWNAEILRKVSGHYQTGEKLPDTLIEKMIEHKTDDSGHFVQRQLYLSELALALFNTSDGVVDPHALQERLHAKYLPHTATCAENHHYAAFGHLIGYGAKYYGYLWSRVFALDMFEQVKKEGLLNQHMGERYIKTVIGRGGSARPQELLRDFLGREPRIDAFARDMKFVC